MTAKEQAIELVDKFMEHTVEWDKIKEVAFDSEFHAKQCALIAVDEMITEITEIISPSIHGFRHRYWNEVKHEIEKL